VRRPDTDPFSDSKFSFQIRRFVNVSLAEQHFRWTWNLRAPPAALWPLVSNTDRFNRDCGFPPVTIVPPPSRPAGVAAPPISNARRLRTRVAGVTIEWDELAFEWLAPRRFGVHRRYWRGPLARMTLSCELEPNATGGTTLTYDVRVTPSGPLGRIAVAFSIGRRARATTERVFRRYDEFALRGIRTSRFLAKPRLAPGASDRFATIARTLIETAGQPESLVQRLRDFIATTDDLTLARIRPYALADDWGVARRDVLCLFLHATRAGLLDFSWDLVCPHCRGAQAHEPTLGAVNSHGHCPTCEVDFAVNFDQSVELTFTPNPALRSVTRVDYCVGGPQVTPHILAQRSVAAGARELLNVDLAAGRYRLRAANVGPQHVFRVANDAAAQLTIDLSANSDHEGALAPNGELTVVNSTGETHLAVLEHLAWTDQAVTAAEVTSLQLFRDLFSREVLRPGEQISVASLTIVFTDLKNSTALYQSVGDAPAFGRVLTHFEILRAAVAAEGGGIIKTMGDAIMAVFPRPVAAVRAMVHAQRWLARPEAFSLPAGINVPPSSLHPLALKAGLHCGPCLAINQNDRLDYFGTTVNVAARLCGLCSGTDIVLSAAIQTDAEVASYLNLQDARLVTLSERTQLKGFGDATFGIARVKTAAI
jgi:class 3 adenylate cyclase